MYSINFAKENTKFWLILHYNGADSYSVVNGTEIIKFKAKDSEITPYELCLGNISKDLSVDNMKKTGFNGLFVILALIMMLFRLLIYWKFTSI